MPSGKQQQQQRRAATTPKGNNGNGTSPSSRKQQVETESLLHTIQECIQKQLNSDVVHKCLADLIVERVTNAVVNTLKETLNFDVVKMHNLENKIARYEKAHGH